MSVYVHILAKFSCETALKLQCFFKIWNAIDIQVKMHVWINMYTCFNIK